MTRTNAIRLLLLAIVLLVFGQVVTHDFVDWDDGVLIYTNPNIVQHTGAGLLHHWEPLNPDNRFMYNPMVFTLWWTIGHAAQIDDPDLLGARINPYPFHAANLVVHWLCACVVFEILRRLKLSDWPAAAGALIFAIHPLQTESVAWAASMKDLLSGLFALLAIWRYIAAVEAGDKQRQRNYWLSTIFFAAALLSKPSTVIIPMIVGVIDLIVYRRSWKTIALWTGPWYVMALIFTVLASKIQQIPPEAHVGGPLWARPLIAADSLAFYLYKLFVPINLQFDYGRSPQFLLTDPSFYYSLYWTWIFPLALTVIIWRFKRKQLILAGLIFVLGVLPVLGLKQFAYQYYTTVADRYVYLSMLGVGLAAGWCLQVYKSRGVAIGAVAAIGILATLSFVQARAWTDTDTLYATLQNHARPEHEVIMGQYQDYQSRPYFRQAERANRVGNYTAQRDYMDSGIALMEKGMFYFRKAIRLSPTDGQAYDFLAKDLVQLGRYPEAIETVKQWIKTNPDADPSLRKAPDRLESMLGSLYLKNRQYPEAVEALKKSLAEKDDPDVRKILDVAEKMNRQNKDGASRP